MDNNKVVTMDGRPLPKKGELNGYNKKVIETLEEILERARAGQIVSVYIVAVDDEIKDEYYIAGGPGTYSTAGMLSRMEKFVIDKLVESLE